MVRPIVVDLPIYHRQASIDQPAWRSMRLCWRLISLSANTKPLTPMVRSSKSVLLLVVSIGLEGSRWWLMVIDQQPRSQPLFPLMLRPWHGMSQQTLAVIVDYNHIPLVIELVVIGNDCVSIYLKIHLTRVDVPQYSYQITVIKQRSITSYPYVYVIH